jgi:hypothetical protein
MAKDHGPSVKNDKQYEGLREEGHEQAAGCVDSQLSRLIEPRREERQGQRRQQVAEARRRSRGRPQVELEVLSDPQITRSSAGDSRRSMRSSAASSIGRWISGQSAGSLGSRSNTPPTVIPPSKRSKTRGSM